MARSDQASLDQLRRRLAAVVRPSTADPAAEPPTSLRVLPRRAQPAVGFAKELDQSAVRTLIRPPEPLPAAPPEDAPANDRPRLRGLLPFDRRHLGVVAVLLSIAVLVGGWALLRARDHAVGAEPVALTVTPPGTAVTHQPTRTREPSGPASGQQDTSATITIHVVGAVHKPGLVQLPDRSRVADAIEAAGGLRDTARPGRLNLAQRLHDGEQVFVSDSDDKPSEVVAAGTANGGTGGATGGSTRAIDLNTATQAQLETLPGVGPATAQAILAWRREHGRFTRVEELQEVDGIGPKTFARLAPRVTV